MNYMKIRKLIIISIRKIHTELRPGDGTGFISCFEKWYGNLYSAETEAEVNFNSDHGDCILFDMCCIVNCNLWPKSTSNVKGCIVQLNAFKNVFNCYSSMKVFKVFTLDDVTEGFFGYN